MASCLVVGPNAADGVSLFGQFWNIRLAVIAINFQQLRCHRDTMLAAAEL